MQENMFLHSMRKWPADSLVSCGFVIALTSCLLFPGQVNLELGSEVHLTVDARQAGQEQTLVPIWPST